MEFEDVVRTTGACRHFSAAPVPHDLLYRAVELARFAPQGGNRQGARLVIVEDADKRRRLAQLYLQALAPFRPGNDDAERDGSAGPDVSGTLRSMHPAAVQDAHHMADHLAEVPAIVVVCVDLTALHVTDAGLDRPSIVGGGSVYPFVQNFLLALRSLGVGAAITTLLCQFEPEVKELLGIPPEYATAAHLPVGFPERPFPRRLTRRPVGELAYVDRFGVPLAWPVSGPAPD